MYENVHHSWSQDLFSCFRSRPASHRRLAIAEDASKIKQLPQCVPWPKNPPSVWCGFLLLTAGLNTPDLVLQGCSAPDRRTWKSLISLLFGWTPGGMLRERRSSFGKFMRWADARVREVGVDFSACSCLDTFVECTLSSSFSLNSSVDCLYLHSTPFSHRISDSLALLVNSSTSAPRGRHGHPTTNIKTSFGDGTWLFHG
jgi:hypothetical protein